MTSSYDSVAQYYDLTQGKQSQRYLADAQHLHSLFQAHHVTKVLDLACGTGSHVIELTKLGYDCTGRDLSSEMIAVAKEKATTSRLNIHFLQGDMRTYDAKEKYDGVLALYALSMVEDQDFSRVLAAAQKTIRPGGLFVFNLINKEAKSPFPPGFPPPPQLLLSSTVKGPAIKLVRFDNIVVLPDLWHITNIFIVEENGPARLIIRDDHMRIHHLDDVKEQLTLHGFRFESVMFRDTMGYKNWDMHICAIAEG
jgi:SAM-dependent methyltransferase